MFNIKILIIITVFGMLLISCTINADETNYCYDLESNQQWDILIQKYPYDMELAALHALRIGLCYKVEKGDISLDQATDIFENVRMQLIGKQKQKGLTKKKFKS